MKKLAILIISLLFVIPLSSCSNGETHVTSSYTVSQEAFTAVNVEEYASQGIMYPLEIKLGDSAETVEKYYKDNPQKTEDGEDVALAVTESNKYIQINAVNEMYYYKSDSDDKISAIVSYRNPYDYPLYRATEDDVKSALGEPERGGNAQDSDIFFMFGTSAERYQVMVYTFNSNRVTFIFYDGTMMAATLVNPAQWGATE